MHAIEVSDISVFYGKACALESVSLSVEQGQLTGLLGRNGAGKTTLLSALMGLLPIASGDYLLRGTRIQGMKPFHLARAGVAFVPADRQIYGSLTVRENLQLATLSRRRGPWSHDRVFKLFPRLLERERGLAENLSGGERQMLAIARALLTNPDILLMDEPTEGLAPILVNEVVQATKVACDEGVSVLVVEQNLKAVAPVLGTAYVLDSGRLAWSGRAVELTEDPKLSESLFGV